MKYLFIIITSLIINMDLIAQSTNTGKGFGCIDLKLSSVQGNSAYMIGARGGWNVGQSFSVGLAVSGAIIDDPVLNITNNREYYIRLGYGGLYVESKFYSYRIVHFTFSAILGRGYYGHSEVKSDYEIDWTKHWIFAFEPELIVMFDVSDIFKIGVGTTYRYVPGVDLTEFKKNHLNGLSVMLSFRFVVI